MTKLVKVGIINLATLQGVHHNVNQLTDKSRLVGRLIRVPCVGRFNIILRTQKVF